MSKSKFARSYGDEKIAHAVEGMSKYFALGP